jgi:ABC-type sugar transport system substrate-binding protein
MKRAYIPMAILAAVAMISTACSSSAPAAQPTTVPATAAAQPTAAKVAQSTAAPAAQPTVAAAPAKPAAPKFDSMGTPDDEGTVKPVDKQPSTAMRIAVLGLENNPFWIPVKQGTQQAAEELKKYNTTVEWIVPGDQHTADVFGRAMDTAITKKYSAIATIAGDEGMVPFINKAVDAGIPVATFNVETAKENKRLFFVGADLTLQGKAAADAMGKVLNGKGKVAIITGFFSVEGHEQRRKGFEDELKAKFPDIQIVGRVENNDKADVAYSQAKDFMTANPDLAGIYVTAGGPFGAAKAIQEAGKAGKVHEICFDYVDETMQFVKSGVIDATIGQDPFAQGHDPAIRLFNYIVGGVVPQYGRLITRSDVVTKDNIDKFWKQQ